jgi:uncharacterized protein GlcG (DUF336 family)
MKLISTFCLYLSTTLITVIYPLTCVALEDATFTTTSLTPQTALKAAQAAMTHCRDQGYQISVAVVDRGGNVQVILRDRLAGSHTPDTAKGKAWTAVSFRTNTTELSELAKPGVGISGIRDLPNVVVLGGGLLIEAAGSIVAGIGVSGAPGGDFDDACAQAGIDAIEEEIQF